MRACTHTRVLFYCHFPDKLLAEGAYVEGQKKSGSLLKRIYRMPMDLLEESTTSACAPTAVRSLTNFIPEQADTILANSRFTCRLAH